jgi:hypothetical protein
MLMRVPTLVAPTAGKKASGGSLGRGGSAGRTGTLAVAAHPRPASTPVAPRCCDASRAYCNVGRAGLDGDPLASAATGNAAFSTCDCEQHVCPARLALSVRFSSPRPCWRAHPAHLINLYILVGIKKPLYTLRRYGGKQAHWQ